MECRLKFDDRPDGKLIFPDRRNQWPRLLYHRHFMLAEFLHQLHVPPYDASLAPGDTRLALDWRADRQRFESVRDSMQSHVASRYAATRVQIVRLEHRLPSSEEVFDMQVALDAPTLYIPLPDAPLAEPLNEMDGSPVIPPPGSTRLPSVGGPPFRTDAASPSIAEEVKP
jgi:hypothetical protein